MRVWYCETHQVADADKRLFAPGQIVVGCYVGSVGFDNDCRMVEKLLVDVTELPDADVGPLPGAVRRRLRGVANGE